VITAEVGTPRGGLASEISCATWVVGQAARMASMRARVLRRWAGNRDRAASAVARRRDALWEAPASVGARGARMQATDPAPLLTIKTPIVASLANESRQWREKRALLVPRRKRWASGLQQIRLRAPAQGGSAGASAVQFRAKTRVGGSHRVSGR